MAEVEGNLGGPVELSKFTVQVGKVPPACPLATVNRSGSPFDHPLQRKSLRETQHALDG